MNNSTFQKLPVVKLISFYELSGFLYFVGLRSIVKLDANLCLVELLKIDRTFLSHLTSKKVIKGTNKFYRRLLELGNELPKCE